MVTKRKSNKWYEAEGCVLAKIHMVTKPGTHKETPQIRCVLAKIHMVTKPIEFGTSAMDALCSSKNPYGNKTWNA